MSLSRLSFSWEGGMYTAQAFALPIGYTVWIQVLSVTSSETLKHLNVKQILHLDRPRIRNTKIGSSITLALQRKWVGCIIMFTSLQSEQQNGISLLPVSTRMNIPHSYSVCTVLLQFAYITYQINIFSCTLERVQHNAAKSGLRGDKMKLHWFL